jgi:phosphohistidine swiveling domain-containing protein
VVGEYLVNAQGEDVVAGIVTPLPLPQMQEWNSTAFAELMTAAAQLEALNHDMQDVEFTVEDGVLYILQTRNAKRTAQAALRIAVDLREENHIDSKQMFERVTLDQYLMAIKPTLHPEFKDEPVLVGLGASSGVVVGKAVFSNESALKCKEPCILVAKETTPDDIAGMHASVGILTSTGGATSHAAVVARGMDKVCVVGAESMEVDAFNAVAKVGGLRFKEGDTISICGHTGRVWLGAVPLVGGAKNKEAQQFIEVARQYIGGLRIVASDCENLHPTGCLLMLGALPAHQQVVGLVGALNIMEQGVIDLRSLAFHLPDADKDLVFALGFEYDLQGIVDVLATTPPKKGLTLISNFPVPGDWNVAGSAGSVEQLLFSTGLVVLDGTPKPEIAKVLELKEKAGEGLFPLNLGRLAQGVSALTDVQLAQTLLKA